MENKVSQRLKQILDYISDRGYVSPKQLCQHFGISKSTISRDLTLLTEQGKINRFHGGVIISDKTTIAPYKLRAELYKEEKTRIARCAANLIEPGDVIYVGSGSTCYELFCNIHTPNVSVFTNNIQCISCCNDKIAHVYALGGEVFPHSETISGMQLLDNFSQTNPNKIFFSAATISSEMDIHCSHFDERYFIQMLVRSQGKKILLADSSKIDARTSFVAVKLDAVDTFITDTNISPEVVEKVKRLNVEILTA